MLLMRKLLLFFLYIIPSNSFSFSLLSQQVTPGLNITTFAWRYLQTPSQSTIQAMSFAANHSEVSSKLRSTAAYWLTMWDDNTKDFEAVVRKGKNLAGF